MVEHHDTSRLSGPVRDFRVAVHFLTRVPTGWIDGLQSADLARAAWAFPLVGVLVGAIAGGVVYVAALPSLHPLACAILGLGVQAWVTGALHEDGIADVADGLGAHDRTRRLEIMRDSRIGSFGVLALVFSVGLRGALLAGVAGPERAWLAMIVAAAVSRAAMVPVMAFVDPARADGLSQGAGKPSTGQVWIALGIAVALASVLLNGKAAVIALVLAGLSTLAVAAWARKSLGGQTGDILGTVQQFAEIAVLIAVAGYGGGFL